MVDDVEKEKKEEKGERKTEREREREEETKRDKINEVEKYSYPRGQDASAPGKM